MRRPIPPLLRWALVAAGCMFVGAAAMRAFGVPGKGRMVEVFPWPFLDMWVRWDAGWYEQIAAREYTYSATEQSAAAYFPLYPLVMRGVMSLFGLDVFRAGIAVTWASGATATVVFHRWARTLKPEAAGLATWLLLLWPFAFFLFGAVYSDALFLLCVTGAFASLERGRVGWATLLGALATATRPIAPAVVLGLAVRHLEKKRAAGEPWRARDFVPLLSGLGLAAYMGFLWWRFGDPLGFMTTQVGWSQLSGPASWLKYGALSKLPAGSVAFAALHAVLAAFALWLGWRARRSLGVGYATYVLAAVGIPLFSSRDFIGLGRYAIAGFPVFLELALLLESRPRWRWAWLLTSGGLLGWLTTRWAMGFYTS